MESQPTTLFKLMALYMLKKVNFPLANSQMTDFFVSKEYTSYFMFQETMNALVEANLVRAQTVRNTTSYELTNEGEDALYYFGQKLSTGIKEDIEAYLAEHKMQFRSEASVVADFYKSSSSQEYVALCELKDRKTTLLSVSISVPTQEQAERVCERWREDYQSIYTYMIQNLLS